MNNEPDPSKKLTRESDVREMASHFPQDKKFTILRREWGNLAENLADGGIITVADILDYKTATARMLRRQENIGPESVQALHDFLAESNLKPEPHAITEKSSIRELLLHVQEKRYIQRMGLDMATVGFLASIGVYTVGDMVMRGSKPLIELAYNAGGKQKIEGIEKMYSSLSEMNLLPESGRKRS